MNNYQILHYHYTLNLKEISFLEVNETENLYSPEINDHEFLKLYKETISQKVEELIKFLKAGNEALIFFSSSFLEMLEKHDNRSLATLQKFVKNGQIELVGSCAFHSFSYLCHPELFKKEVALHIKSYHQYFDKHADIFVNTACLFDDRLVEYLEEFNFKTLIATANSWHLSGIQSTETYQSVGEKPMKILLSNGDNASSAYLSLSNGYGSAYENNQLGHSDLKGLEKIIYEEENPGVYSASMPLSSPEWTQPISNYMSNPLQRAFINECKRLVEAYYDRFDEVDWISMMLLCQPDKLLQISKSGQSTSYQSFIGSMNILTALGLKHNQKS